MWEIDYPEMHLRRSKIKFKGIIEKDYKNRILNQKQYDSFKFEIDKNNLYVCYGMYISYLLTNKTEGEFIEDKHKDNGIGGTY